MTTTIKVWNGRKPSLKEAQDHVGGYVEMIELSDGSQLLINEEGLLHNLPDNIEASHLAGMPIVGNAIHLIGKARWR